MHAIYDKMVRDTTVLNEIFRLNQSGHLNLEAKFFIVDQFHITLRFNCTKIGRKTLICRALTLLKLWEASNECTELSKVMG